MRAISNGLWIHRRNFKEAIVYIVHIGYVELELATDTWVDPLSYASSSSIPIRGFALLHV